MKSKNNVVTDLPFEPDSDRPAELDELNFNDEDEPSFLDFLPEDELGILEEQVPNDSVDEEPTNDDLTPEILIPDDGARSPHEPGGTVPSDESLSIVGEDEIGEGYGLDEAELARVDPLDGKPAEGKPLQDHKV
ncbi:MAG: serine kinase/phosphatase [Gammaproteobacteria bacterium]|nr:MAG: serine kinase/phosphatase [Gammaproteobacteria bacterium]